MDDSPAYIRCRNCGTHVPETEAYRGWYCTRECAEVYVACSTCGRYFSVPREETQTDTTKENQAENHEIQVSHYCSPECTADFTAEYKGNFREALLKAADH